MQDPNRRPPPGKPSLKLSAEDPTDKRARQLAKLLRQASLPNRKGGSGQDTPDVCEPVPGGFVAVASLVSTGHGCRPVLEVIDPDDVRDWLDALWDYQRAHPKADLADALHECRP